MAVAMPAQDASESLYPVRLWMTYPERLSRLSTFFRIFLAIPVFLFLALLGAGSVDVWQSNDDARNVGAAGGAVGGSLVLAIWVTILLRRNIPRWLFDFQVGLHRFTYRAFGYAALLTDKYPAFEGDWDLQYWVDYPPRLSRWKVFVWKLITIIPHAFVLLALTIAAVLVVVAAWFAILFTGRFPRGLHDFVVGVMRWQARVTAYFESLTDAFPPFSLDHEAGPGSKSAETISAIIGGVLLALTIAAVAVVVTLLALFFMDEKSTRIAYDDVTGATVQSTIRMDDVEFTLVGGEDPARPELLAARDGKRLVSFTVAYRGDDAGFIFGRSGDPDSRDIRRDSLLLETDDDSSIEPVLLTFNGSIVPVEVDERASGEIVAFFEIDDDDAPEELRAYPNPQIDRHVAWEFDEAR